MSASNVALVPATVGSPPYEFRRFISAETIQAKVARLGEELAGVYRDRDPILVGVLNGCFIFLADLVREMNIPCTVVFLQLSSYRDAMHSGRIDVLKHVEVDLHGRHVLIVEDIVDTGNSLQFLRSHLESCAPASIAMASMFVKESAVRIGRQPEYTGMIIPDDFVVGYGLDYAGQWRHLPDLYVLNKESAQS